LGRLLRAIGIGVGPCNRGEPYIEGLAIAAGHNMAAVRVVLNNIIAGVGRRSLDFSCIENPSIYFL
jgi:hypothetical protein